MIQTLLRLAAAIALSACSTMIAWRRHATRAVGSLTGESALAAGPSTRAIPELPR